MRKYIEAEQLRDLLSYDLETGFFYWKERGRGRKFGMPAGGISNTDKYIYLCIHQRRYGAHRMAWLHVHGVMPPHEIDHVNGIRHDNRFSNLRSCTRLENSRNVKRRTDNTTGIKGVSFEPKKNTWYAYISIDKRMRNLGHFKTMGEAVTARSVAQKLHYGEFARDS